MILTKDIENIKDQLRSESLVDEDYIDKLTEVKNNLPLNDVSLAYLFIQCYDYFTTLLPKVESLDSDFAKELKEKLIEVKNDVDILRKLVDEYDNGNSIGDYSIKHKIVLELNPKRDSVVEWINLFFELFGGD